MRVRQAAVVGAIALTCWRLGAQAPAPRPAPPAAQIPPAAPEAPAGDDPANAGADYSAKPPVIALSAEDEAKRFWLPPGYRIEPVLSDPDIDSPAQIAFDGNGRLFLVELRGYVQTLDGIDSISPVGRISVHEDRNGDGVFEHHAVFVDKLLFPRFVMPFGANSVLTMETHADEVWKYTDTNGDGSADKKELFTANFGRGGNLEHQPSSLFWGMDNWMYSTVNAFRLRWTPNGLLREPTGANGAQWGVTQDNDGKIWFQAGASGMPAYFQLPIHYGSFPVSDQIEPNLNVVWGAPILLGDIQAGLPGTRLPDGSLIRSTAGAGNEVYRGDRLPADLVGDYLYGEVVARAVRRLRPVKTDGLTQLRNANPLSEFIRSVDPLFRPTDVTTGPDGTLYIADMYRGVIEGAPWAMAGTYLRRKIDQYQLDKVLGHGRVWRLTYDGIARDRTQPHMLSETPSQLVAHLAHPNGWWRDTAQQLLVLRQDTSVAPALRRATRAAGPAPPYGRFHALWTLEGLGALDATLVRELLRDANPSMRVQAIRASETLYKAGDRSFLSDYRALSKDANADVAIQAMLTLNLFKVGDLPAAIQAAQSATPARGVQEIGRQILQAAAAPALGGRNPATLTADERGALERGATIYNELCFACHGGDGRGTVKEGSAPGTTMAPSLASSQRIQSHRDYVVKAVMHGMAGPIDGKTYAEVMVPMGTNKDEWVADIASFVRNSFGNTGSVVTPADVARVRAMTPSHRPWTAEELVASLPRPLIPDATWKARASENAAGAARALDYTRWSSGSPQRPGMWIEIELPQPVTLAEVQFDSPAIAGGRGVPPTPTFPRGYRVTVSEDGAAWSAPVAEGEGAGRSTTIAFAPVRARVVRITQTGSAESAPWTIERLRLFESPPGR